MRNNSSNALSSFLSSADKASPTATSAVDTNGKSNNSQLRVRHLERESTYAGYLTKFSSRTFFSRKQWKRRYFILHEKALYCFKSSDPQHPLLESLTLSPDAIICVTDIFAGKRYCLQIACPDEKPWYVLADTAPEMSGWLKELKNAVQKTRNNTIQLLPASRPGTVYSDEDEISELSGTSVAIRVPTVPAIPVQYEYKPRTRESRTMSGTLLPSVHHAQAHQYQLQQRDLYMAHTAASLTPPPRTITPKPSTPTPGPGPQQAQPTLQPHVYGALSSSSPSQFQHLQPVQTQQQVQPSADTRRRRNSSLSAAQSSDYASFGSVMARAEAMAEAQREQPSSTWSIPTKSERPDVNYATIPRSRRESIMSTISNSTNNNNMSSAPMNHRASVITSQSENIVPIPHRSAQRPTGTSSRPISAAPRPQSPNLPRPSPRSSLVISPPPRSIHRPTSVSIRHSTQILPPPQIVTAGLPSQPQPASPSSTVTPNSTASSSPITPDSDGNQGTNGSLRLAGIRHLQGLNRHSVMSITTTPPVGSAGGAGSPRSPSRTSMLRPLSPTPSLADAPTQPLPEPPRAGSISPTKSGQSTPPTCTLPSIDSTRRNPAIPRHHEPDLPIPNRSKARVRSQSQSQEAFISAKLGGIQIARRATTPSPRLSAILTSTKAIASSTGDNKTANGNGGNEPSSPKATMGGHRHLSLPLHTMYVFPAPPTGQVPSKPSNLTGSRPLMQKGSGPNPTFRPISSSMSNVASLGGGVARRLSGAAATKGELAVAGRLSTIIVLPPGPTTAIPLPPTSSLPTPPTTALPEKPISAVEEPIRMDQGSRRVKFGVILEETEHEEDEDEDEDEDEEVDHQNGHNHPPTGNEARNDQEEEDEEDDEYGEEYVLQFEDLEAAKAAAEQSQDPDSAVTTPTVVSRPEYYATKESKIVEYIFPSESFQA
ncbi:hypothetical protein BGX31_001112 [Mortierella sp. GBA43]|nr:hypothetical protein BGX31_001112 [Mortierella sp. GBA43]